MNAPLTSPSFPNGIPAIGSEAEARAARPVSMFSTIQRGAVETVKAQRIIPNDCPHCRADAPLMSKTRGYYFYSCDTIDCPAYAEGETPAEALESWNALVSGGMK